MEKSKNTTLRYYIDLIVVCALAFVSAYMLLPKGGKWATLPFCIIALVLKEDRESTLQFMAASYITLYRRDQRGYALHQR